VCDPSNVDNNMLWHVFINRTCSTSVRVNKWYKVQQKSLVVTKQLILWQQWIYIIMRRSLLRKQEKEWHISQTNYRMTNITCRNVVQGGSSIAYLYRFGYWGISLEAICHIQTFPCCYLWPNKSTHVYLLRSKCNIK